MAVKILDGKYEILEEIKRGGFGIISFGRDLLFDKPIALKTLPPALLGEAQYLDLFQAESLAVARLNHHNIIRIYDLKRDAGGQFYIIMEYVDGVNLQQLLKARAAEKAGLPPALSAYLLAEICAGLDYAHTRRDPDTHQPLHLVHQDISPGNIMVNRLGEVKIIDFGLSGARRRRSRKNEVFIQGKPGYLAPEQVEDGRLDHRTDIFALGLVLYELLTGKRLMADPRPESSIEKLRAGAWDLSALRNTGTPEVLIQIIAHALQKDPALRYQSANHMYLELIDYLAAHTPATDFALELGMLVQQIAPVRQASTTAVIEDAIDFSLPFAGHAAASPPPPQQQQEEKPEAEPLLPLHEDGANLFSSFSNNGANEKNNPPVAVEISSPAEHEAAPFNEVEAPPQGAFYRVLDEEEEEGEVRTMIDVVRLSARTHRKAILRAGGGVLAAFILFLLADIFLRWTALGASIYDYLFPPAIRLVSFPPGAQVYLDDKPLPKPTPLAIDDIAPGVHKLTLTLPRFEPIVRSIQVLSQGKVAVAGESKRAGDQPYIFHFKTVLEISSEPAGAEVYLNGLKHAHLTPCRIVVEVGDPVKVELRKAGLAALQGFTLDTGAGTEAIEDRRLWRCERIEGPREHFAVAGIFAKQIKLNSIPSFAEIFIDGGESPIGVTGYATDLLMPMGTHSLTLQKEGYLPKTLALAVDETSPTEYQEMLARVVRVFAKRAGDASDNDIGAQVTELAYNDRRTRLQAQTPCELTLLPLAYTVTLVKEGYGTYTLTIPPGSNLAIARMSPGSVDVEMMVLDGQTGAPLVDAEIFYQAASGAFSGRTDADGVFANALAPETYTIQVKKNGYQTWVQDYQITASGQQTLVFRLSPTP